MNDLSETNCRYILSYSLRALGGFPGVLPIPTTIPLQESLFYISMMQSIRVLPDFSFSVGYPIWLPITLVLPILKSFE